MIKHVPVSTEDIQGTLPSLYMAKHAHNCPFHTAATSTRVSGHIQHAACPCRKIPSPTTKCCKRHLRLSSQQVPPPSAISIVVFCTRPHLYGHTLNILQHPRCASTAVFWMRDETLL